MMIMENCVLANSHINWKTLGRIFSVSQEVVLIIEAWNKCFAILNNQFVANITVEKATILICNLYKIWNKRKEYGSIYQINQTLPLKDHFSTVPQHLSIYSLSDKHSFLKKAALCTTCWLICQEFGCAELASNFFYLGNCWKYARVKKLSKAQQFRCNIHFEVDELVPDKVLAAYLKLRKIKHSLKHFFKWGAWVAQ